MSEKPDSKLAEAAARSFASPFGALLKLDPEGRPPLWIDGRGPAPKILTKAPKGAEADCVWRGAEDSLIRAIANDRAFESSYISGRVTVAGDMSVAARVTLGAKG